MPTSETIPYVAEVMGATSYEESIEDVGGKVKRVQRKLTGPEHKEPDLDQEEQYAEYQGVIGRPGVDFPVLPSIPRTDFSCRKVKSSGYYADLETGCQVFHICDGGRKISFLCPNGTIFRQSHLICDWWFRVDCERSVEQYEESAEQLAHDQMIYRKRAEEIAQAMAIKSGVSTPVPTRPSTSTSYNLRQQKRKPQPQVQQQDSDSSELERQIPAETASFASNRHRFGNQIENQYRQYLQSTSTSSSVPYNNGQQNYEYNTEKNRDSTQNNFDRQVAYDENQNGYSNINSNSGSINNKNNFQSANSGNFPSKINNYPTVAGNGYQSNSNNYQTPTNNNYPNNNNYPTSGSADYSVSSNNDFPTSTNSNYPNSNNNNYATSTISNYPNTNNNNYPTSTNRNPSVNNNNYPESNNNYPKVNKNENNYSNSNNFVPSTNSNYPNVHNYPSSTNRNYPVVNNNNYPTTSSYKYENKEYLANNNNPNSNNSPAANNENQSFTVTNYSITSNVNKYSQGNSKNNYPNRGNTNYFNSNNNYNPNPSSTTTIKSPVYSGSPDIISSYNYSSSEKGSTYASKTEKYREYSKSETHSERGRVKSNRNNDYIPTASTTVRSVTNKVYNEHTPRYEKYTSSGIKQKPIFNVKIKPTKDTKDFAYVELLRHEEKIRNSQKVTSESPIYSSSLNPSSQESIQQTIAVSQSINTVPPTKAPTSSRHTYLPTKLTTKASDIKVSPVTNRYASINVSGTAEEIRPEVVNALMESGVTPTSAKALHSLASYISSGAAETDYTNVYDDKNHPHVSDVILNFHSGSPVTTAYSSSEATTTSPQTSSGEELPSVLTRATKESYSYLFSDSKEETDSGKDESKAPGETVTISPKPVTTVKSSTTTVKPVSSTSPKPQTTSQAPQNVKGTSIKQEGKGEIKLKDSTELRELAQVFSRALSAYLEDPETFKEILAQVRPTEPNVDNTTPSIEDEVLDFSDAMLGRLGTTVSPITTVGNSDYIDDNINIGEINSLAGASKTYEPDNSLEQNTFPPTAPEAYRDSRYSSATPKLLLFKANTPSNNSDSSDYYSKLGSAEDQSYFPTVGGVSDTTRPRYGGFQNNTGNIVKPYGSDVPKNITGAPLSSSSPTTISEETVSTETYNVSSTVQTIPEPHDVNSLIKSNVLNSDRGSSEEAYDTFQTSPSFVELDSFYPTGEQEKVLITSGSQSLVSSNNYVQFAKKFNEEAQLKGKEQLFKSKSPESSLDSRENSGKQEDLSPYFGQEPPLENLAVPSGFKSPSVTVLNKDTNTQNNSARTSFFSESDPINYHIGTINEELATPSPLHLSSQDYDVSYNDFSTGFGVSSGEHKSSTGSVPYNQPTWTVSPVYDVTSAGTSLQFNYTKKPVFPSSHHSVPKLHPTTYHPPHSSESSEITDPQWDSTYQTESTPAETTPAYDLNVAGTTLSFDDQYKNFEQAAKEMFGMLNETASAKLMDMMAKGESNMTIRRLVLLLVNDKARENKTAQESRESLINALLTNIEESPITTLTPSTVALTTTTTQVPKKKVRVSRIRISTPAPSRYDQRSGKSYRGTDSMTGVYGSVSSASDINKINSAKLYIPSPSSEPLTSKLPLDSDARAVELLKTLYSLAAKWG